MDSIKLNQLAAEHSSYVCAMLRHDGIYDPYPGEVTFTKCFMAGANAVINEYDKIIAMKDKQIETLRNSINEPSY